MSPPDPISLMCLAPEPQCRDVLALRLSADLANLLNFDKGLPDGIKTRKGAPLETSETILSFTRDWCQKKSAMYFAIVLHKRQAIGSISLSHLNSYNRSAQCGYWIGSAFQGQGYGTGAFSKVLTISRELGLRQLSATIQTANVASKRIWQNAGASFQYGESEIRATIVFS
ncbi:MAG: N-acetyltransferase [Rhodospirillales bacterium]|nr:MAG: N-acetyltransferase [Rhodospirillales bacterium]